MKQFKPNAKLVATEIAGKADNTDNQSTLPPPTADGDSGTGSTEAPRPKGQGNRVAPKSPTRGAGGSRRQICGVPSDTLRQPHQRRPRLFKQRVQELIRRHLPPHPRYTGKPMSRPD